MEKLVRVTTIPLSLEKLLEGQLSFMSEFYEVTAVSSEFERLRKYGKDNGVEVFHVEMTRVISPFKDLKSLFNLYKFLRTEKPLIIHTHTPKAGIIGMLAGKMAGVPIRLHTVAGLPLLEVQGFKRKILDIVEKLTYSLAHKVYPNSFGLKKIILDLGYAEDAKLKVLGNGSSNGIDLEYFNPSNYSEAELDLFRNKWNISKDDFVYIFVGRLVSEKGINELVTCFQEINNTQKHVKLILVGPFEEELDPLKPEVFEAIQNTKNIITTGYQVDVRPFFAISNVLTFPSYREGFPNVVMQANAMNLPAIVSNINGCNEIITEHKNGIIIPVKDTSRLKQAMLDLLHNREKCKNMAAISRDVIQKKYDRKQFWQVLLKEYKELEGLYKHS